MADAGAAAPNDASRNDGFRQAMLKPALDTTPQLMEENYFICVSTLDARKGIPLATSATKIPYK
ncbi:hypothetical protein VP01_1294g3 [Puccinia sorghi]|uniref:Uncharacterized protein n=1 Tax=Puccinia sorghi TaxID=27349 RepID=A0A0L6VNA2_9BASI|nr:hypothetical protein VP01_1294g3 [Puccinia sorghi]